MSPNSIKSKVQSEKYLSKKCMARQVYLYRTFHTHWQFNELYKDEDKEQ